MTEDNERGYLTLDAIREPVANLTIEKAAANRGNPVSAISPITPSASGGHSGFDGERSGSLVREAELINPFSQLRIYRADIGSGSAALLSCKCGGRLTPIVTLLPRARVELTAIACLKCRTITTVHQGVIFPDAEQAPRRGVASNTTAS